MTDEHKALVEWLNDQAVVHDQYAAEEIRLMMRQIHVVKAERLRKAATALEAAHAARIAAEAENRVKADWIEKTINQMADDKMRLDAAEAREREATALLRSFAFSESHTTKDAWDFRFAARAFLAGSPAPRDVAAEAHSNMTRVCEIADAVCYQNCGNGPCKRHARRIARAQEDRP